MPARPFPAIVAELADATWALHALSACFTLGIPSRLPAAAPALAHELGAPLPVVVRLLDVLAALELAEETDGTWAATPALAEVRDVAFWRSELFRFGAQAGALGREARAGGLQHGWHEDDPDVIEAQARHAIAMTDRLFVRGAFPELPGLVARLGAPGASVLDVGTGAAGNAVAFARAYPHARVVGVDVSPASLALAAARVAAEGLGDRIELRRQSIADLPDRDAHDVVWLPQMFFDDALLEAALVRCVASLRPGGWLVTAWIASDGFGVASAVANLRDALFGGRARTAPVLHDLLQAHALEDVRAFRHGDALGVIAGRRA